MLATSFTAADLSFQAEPHTYFLPGGLRVPSVTQILEAVGVSVDFEDIATRSTWIASRIEFKRRLGTAVHADCHAYDDDDLEFSLVHPDVLPFVRAWGVCRDNLRLHPVARERRVFHRGCFYCGTLDGIFETPDGKRILIDIKTGDPESAAAHLQTAAYEAAYILDHQLETIDERWSVQLIPERKAQPYQITNYSARPDSWRDFAKFQACVTAYFEQPAQRRGLR